MVQNPKAKGSEIASQLRNIEADKVTKGILSFGGHYYMLASDPILNVDRLKNSKGEPVGMSVTIGRGGKNEEFLAPYVPGTLGQVVLFPFPSVVNNVSSDEWNGEFDI